MEQLTIKFLNGETLSLPVSLDATVAELKKQIHQRTGVEAARQRLTAQNGKRVDLDVASKTLRQYGLSSGWLVLLLITEPASIQVFLKNEKNQTHCYEIAPGETVSQFKRKVQEKEHVPADQQRLIYEGKQMEDGKKMDDYGVRAESLIYLLLRLRGGEGYWRAQE